VDTIKVVNQLQAPHEGQHSILSTLIAARTRLPNDVNDVIVANSVPEGCVNTHSIVLWTAEWWGLNNSKLFQTLQPDTQGTIITACNQTLLNEAYFIEKSGLAYTAKMVLLAKTTDIAQLYALIGADEARHLAWLEPYMNDADKIRPCGAFLAFLSQSIENTPPHLLVYLIQVILEGWGLDHYKRLAEGCQHQALRQVFLAILKDEALHHKSGHLLFDAAQLQPEDLEQIAVALKSYASMVRVGRWTVVEAIHQILGALTVNTVEEILIALRHPEDSLRKLQLLQSLMYQPGIELLVDELVRQDYFTPLSPQLAAQAYISAHL
jgi:rubrerythrin